MNPKTALNMSASLNDSLSCNDNLTSFNQSMESMYTYFYLLLFIPGLLLNTMALWVLCRHISKKTKAVIFMINLALADLAHVLSLPLRIYYYFTLSWPFGHSICLLCFYLKFFNMYASIVFLVCISIQRCAFLLHPFSARRWRRRYDLLISMAVWVGVGVACSPFILMRSDGHSPTVSSDTSLNSLRSEQTFSEPQSPALLLKGAESSASPHKRSCFKDLPIRRVSQTLGITMMTLCELFGFLIPLACIGYSSARIVVSLRRKELRAQQSSSVRSRVQSFSSSSGPDKPPVSQAHGEKRRALRMVLSCCALFLFCFAPYHVNFLLYLMVSQNLVTHCGTQLAVKQFHPVSLCMASLSCCLNPLLYYFLTSEFRRHLRKRTSSCSSSIPGSPVSSPTEFPGKGRPLRLESTCL